MPARILAALLAITGFSLPVAAAAPRPPDAGTTERVSVSSAGAQADVFSYEARISANGRFILFSSLATNLVLGDTNEANDVFLRDRLTGTTDRISVSSSGEQGNAPSGGAAISADGRYVAFASYSTNLVAHDTNGAADVFVRDRMSGTTRLVSLGTSGAQGDGTSWARSISADGRYVGFESFAGNLVAGDTNLVMDAFVRDRVSGTTERISVDGGSGTQGNAESGGPTISGNGRFVAFHSIASNLVPGDNNGDYDTFVHDRATGTTERISVTSSGVEGNARSFAESISSSGRIVAFVSLAGNLVPDDHNGNFDVFVHDRRTATTVVVSQDMSGNPGRYSSSSGGAITPDGLFVTFASSGRKIVPGDTNDKWDVFVRNLRTGAATRVSVGTAGEANDLSFAGGISADGRSVTFESDASNLVPGDTNGVGDIFVHDQALSGG